MRFGNFFKKNLLLFAVVTATFCFCIGQLALAESSMIIGWTMGMCRVPYGSSATGKIVFAKGEIIDMPVHINDRKDSPDYRDIHIETGTPTPRFLERVAMGESKYRAGGADKPGEGDSRDYDDLMPLFEGGICFDQSDSRITDEATIQSKIDRFKNNTKPEFRFIPTAEAPFTLPDTNPDRYQKQAAVQIEFFVEDGVGKVRITNNCSVLCYRRDNDNKTWDFKIKPGTNATQFERYYIYAYHVMPVGGEILTISLEQTYVNQSFGGVESEPGGQIFVEGNVIIGGDNDLSPDQVIKGTVAVVATGNIWVADSIVVDGSHDANGMPSADNPNAIGLIAQGVIKVIDPGISGYSTGSPNYYPGPPTSVPSGYIYIPVARYETGATYKRYLPDPTVVEAAITVGGGGWGAENVQRGSSYGGRKQASGIWDDLILRGAITECTRGVVGLVGTDGYLKYYYFDERILEGIVPGDIWLFCQYLAGDISGNCVVDWDDLRIFTEQWLEHSGSANLDNFNGINLFDFALLAANWLIDCDIDPDNPACIPK